VTGATCEPTGLQRCVYLYIFTFHEDLWSMWWWILIWQYYLLVLLVLYTVNHKKRATLFLIIILAFLGRFLYFSYQWKQEGILYKWVNKNLPLHPNCVSTLPGKTKTAYKQHILSQSLQYVRSNQLATFAQSHPMFVFFIFFGRKFFFLSVF